MQAMVLTRQAPPENREAGETPLVPRELPLPAPGPEQVRIRVEACAICRTDLHVIDGDLPAPRLPLIPGHEIVGIVEEARTDPGPSLLPETPAAPGIAAAAPVLAPGTRIGVPWLGWTCGECRFCLSGAENLCPKARFTGLHVDGGFAAHAVADARFAFPLPQADSPTHAAPLLCAGLIGYRSLRLAGDADAIGFYGFGASAHVVAQVAVHQGRKVYAFTRPGDRRRQGFARDLGCCWAGGSDQMPPELLDAAILFAPVGSLVVNALHATRPGGTVVCAGIHMSDIPSFPYRDLWEERILRSVANLTRQDAAEFLNLAPRIPVRTCITTFPLSEANEAIGNLRQGRLNGAAVLVP